MASPGLLSWYSPGMASQPRAQPAPVDPAAVDLGPVLTQLRLLCVQSEANRPPPPPPPVDLGPVLTALRVLRVQADETAAGLRTELAALRKILVKNIPVLAFAGLLDLQRGTAECIWGPLKHLANRDGIVYRLQLAVGCFDTCTTMFGATSGVATRMVLENPNCAKSKCLSHKKALGLKKAFEGESFLENSYAPGMAGDKPFGPRFFACCFCCASPKYTLFSFVCRHGFAPERVLIQRAHWHSCLLLPRHVGSCRQNHSGLRQKERVFEGRKRKERNQSKALEEACVYTLGHLGRQQ